MTAYYNEIDEGAAAWLQNLIDAGLIAPGVIDTRSIEDVTPNDLKGFKQVHFFAGIGVWSYSLRLAGWPDDKPVWTGSCPCQPFSSAGKRKGLADKRHLWPEFFRLIRECRPGVVFGEQVASKDGLQWFDAVQTDLESADYAAAAIDLCAAGFGAPHIRQRLFWVANADRNQYWRALGGSGGEAAAVRQPQIDLSPRKPRRASDSDVRGVDDAERDRFLAGRGGDYSGNDGKQLNAACKAVGLVDAVNERREGERLLDLAGQADFKADGASPAIGLAYSVGEGSQGRLPGREDSKREDLDRYARRNGAANDLASDGSSRPTNGYWRNADWLFCRDGKWRAVEPGAFPLANGATARVVRLRAYGNAIVAPVAEAFITSYMEAANDDVY